MAPVQEQLAPEAIDHAVYVAASHPIRLLALAAFAETPEEDITVLEAFVRVRTATQGQGTPLKHRKDLSSFTNHCANTLAIGGYIEEPTTEEPTPETPTFQITGRGIRALATVGAVALWEHRHDELSLRELFGSVRHDSDGNLGGGPAARMAILSQLMVCEDGLPMTTLAAISPSADSSVRSLRSTGILELHDKIDRSRRSFYVEPPSKYGIYKVMSATTTPEVKAIYLAAARLTAGRTGRNVSGSELLEAAQRAAPKLKAGALWAALTNHRPQCVTPTDNEKFGGKSYKTSYTIVPEFHSAIGDLLATIQTLKTDEVAQHGAAAYARNLLHDAPQTASLVTKGLRRSRAQSSDPGVPAADIVANLIPETGIAIRDLLEAVVARRTMSLPTLRNYLAKMPGALLERRPVQQGGHRMQSWITQWKRRFPSNWRERAACADSPELFFPIGATGLSAVQVEQAKVVCESCPVRPACLKSAVESGEDGIWGGFTEDERRQLPTDVLRVLGHVTVAP
jgi:WhiB family redox-sensing transcriptional regulator